VTLSAERKVFRQKELSQLGVTLFNGQLTRQPAARNQRSRRSVNQPQLHSHRWIRNRLICLCAPIEKMSQQVLGTSQPAL
jgi:hypothetical protein